MHTTSWNESGKFILKMIFSHKVFDKNLVKINKNKNWEKNTIPCSTVRK